jgi:hypothetical protein
MGLKSYIMKNTSPMNLPYCYPRFLSGMNSRIIIAAILGKLVGPALNFLLLIILLFVSHGVSKAQSLDNYGGFKDIQRQPTGFFRLEKINNRDFLITPEGHPFIVLSVVHVSWGKDPAIPFEDIHKNLKSLSFNCAGYQLGTELRSMMPYIEGIWIKGAKRERPIGKNAADLQYEFNDVFDPAILKINEGIIKGDCERNKDNPFYIGYYFMDRPVWDMVLARKLFGIDYPAYIKRLPSGAPGKIAYAAFLKTKYSGNIKSLNKAYHTSFTSFESVLDYGFPDLSAEGSREFLDDMEFHGVIAEQYYSTTVKFIKQYDPNHLIFGDRFKLHPLTGTFGDESVLKVAGKYVDVISVEPDFTKDFDPEVYNHLHVITGRPIMIGDHDVEGFSPEMGLVAYYKARASAVAKYKSDAFTTGYIVGYGKCQYFDRPGENLPRGLVDSANVIRTEYAWPIRESNEAELRKAYEAARILDM